MNTKNVDDILTTREEVEGAPVLRDPSQLKNRYFIHMRGEAIPWNPLDEKQDTEVYAVYFSRVFVAMEQRLNVEGLTVYLTWSMDALPSCGQDVVAVVLDDEWSRIPKYFDKVRAVFKTHGTRLPLGGNFLTKPSYLNFLSLVRFLRIQIYRVPGVVRYLAARAKVALQARTTPPVFHIPLGYANQADLPIKDILARPYDVYFSGSVDNQVYPFWAPQRWLQTPKSYARKLMIARAQELQRKRPDLHIELDVTPFYTPHLTKAEREKLQAERGARSYSEEMMDTKICLVPRGTTLETARLYEGLRYGCVVIAEVLPSEWYLEDVPAIQIEDWSDLEDVVENLLDDEQRLQEKHEEALAWWKARCSETAIGVFMAEQLNAMLTDQG